MSEQKLKERREAVEAIAPREDMEVALHKPLPDFGGWLQVLFGGVVLGAAGYLAYRLFRFFAAPKDASSDVMSLVQKATENNEVNRIIKQLYAEVNAGTPT